MMPNASRLTLSEHDGGAFDDHEARQVRVILEHRRAMAGEPELPDEELTEVA